MLYGHGSGHPRGSSDTWQLLPGRQLSLPTHVLMWQTACPGLSCPLDSADQAKQVVLSSENQFLKGCFGSGTIAHRKGNVCVTSPKNYGQKMQMVGACTTDSCSISLPMLWICLASSEICKSMQSCNTHLETSGAFGLKHSSKCDGVAFTFLQSIHQYREGKCFDRRLGLVNGLAHALYFVEITNTCEG